MQILNINEHGSWTWKKHICLLLRSLACCLLARLVMMWSSCPSLCAQLFLSSHLFCSHTHTHLCFLSAFFASAFDPLAQFGSVDYSSLTATMILHKQHLSAHLSLFPPGCPLSSVHLRSISASLPPRWKSMLPPQLKNNHQKSPFISLRLFLDWLTNTHSISWWLDRTQTPCRKALIRFHHIPITVSPLKLIIHLWSNVLRCWGSRGI